ncbi:helix-turn-helix domain-containing protein [Devosia equisanguinis]|uniref:helix-turn-helix domain-containing protein n=1 Tax=Devosia equisanguinis TaxID=2490941 RepID=UPI000F7F72FB|nr:helix-turn-helix transcriptional regulator [Devosia equisanguinis]
MDGRARIAWNLRRLRALSGITQEGLAGEADVDRTYISGIENRSFNATVDILDRLASALKVDVQELLTVPPANADQPPNQRPGRKPNSR